MFIRSKAPLRLGFAGGGTDVSPYSDEYGGAILNASINYYARASITPRADSKIVLTSIDQRVQLSYVSEYELPITGTLDLLKGVYNRLIKEYSLDPLSFELTTCVDAPPGSGLGSSSTLVIAIIGAFVEWLNLPLGEYDIAHLAYEIERIDLDMAGGKQDQYAATFGGFNYMEFFSGDNVIVNPLRIKQYYINELEHNLVLYYTGTSRLSSKIIEAQRQSVQSKQEHSINSMHRLKEQALLMKEALLKGRIDEIGEILNFGWENKKKMAPEITNPLIDEIYDIAIKSGASGGKISGAGGGGFMIFYCSQNKKYSVIDSLKSLGGEVRPFQFASDGLLAWSTA